MEDWSRMDSLHKQILELQEKLRNHTASGKSRTASKLTAKYTFDEINSMNLGLQAKLLRVLQEGTVRRVGGATEISVDVRVLSNTNIPPYQAMEENKLRRDLFYRLGVVNITIPPLRERKEDIPLLVKTFIMQCNQKLERNIREADRNVLDVFYAYDWPGNVRE